MNEARRILRYVFPGSVFILELVLYALISKIVVIDHSVLELIIPNALGLSALLLFISGAIGFFIAIFWYTISWYIFGCLKLNVNYRDALMTAKERKLLDLRYSDDREIPPNLLSKNEAWSIFTTIWQGIKESSSVMKGVNGRADILSDIFHGSGIMLIGSIMALIIWGVLFWFRGCQCLEFTFILALLIVTLHFLNYIQTRNNLRDIYTISFFIGLEYKNEAENKMFKVYYQSPSDNPCFKIISFFIRRFCKPLCSCIKRRFCR